MACGLAKTTLCEESPDTEWLVEVLLGFLNMRIKQLR